MPIYEYACNECGHRLDALQKMSEEPLSDCPECGKSTLKRLISAPRFRLKGGGWYETDFKKDNQRNVLKSDSESDKGSSKESVKTETADTAGKAAAKPESSPTTSGKSSSSAAGE